MLFVVEHNCLEAYPAATGFYRRWILLAAASAASACWQANNSEHIGGPLHNVQRVALKAMLVPANITREPYICLTIPELEILNWPIPFQENIVNDVVGTSHQLMFQSSDYDIEFYPPMATLSRFQASITTAANNSPLEWPSSTMLLLLLEVDCQPAALQRTYMPRPLPSRLLLVDNYEAQRLNSPFKFRFELLQPCRNVSKLILQQLACPAVDNEDTSIVKLCIRNLGIEWLLPYGGRRSRSPYVPRTLAVDPTLYIADMPPTSVAGHMDIELQGLNPVSGNFETLVPHPLATCLTVCFVIKAVLQTA